MAQVTLMTGPERRRRWGPDDRRQILMAAFAPGAVVADVSRQFEISTSLIYKWRRQALSANCGGTSFIPAVVVDEPRCSPGKAASEESAPISVALPDGTRVSIGATAPATLVTVTLRALR